MKSDSRRFSIIPFLQHHPHNNYSGTGLRNFIETSLHNMDNTVIYDPTKRVEWNAGQLCLYYCSHFPDDFIFSYTA